jgi:hypothetical protein
MHISRAAKGTAAVVTAALLTWPLAGCAAPSSTPAIAYPSATVPQVYAASPVPVTSYTGYAPPYNAVTTTLSGLAANTTLAFPMQWANFTVTLRNTSSFSFKNIEPLLVLGTCTCNPKGHDIAPHTTIEFDNPTTNAWQTLEVASMDSTGLYKDWNEVPEVALPAQSTVTLQYRMKLAKSADLQTGVVPGPGTLDVFLLQEPDRTRLSIGSGPDATASLTYSVN